MKLEEMYKFVESKESGKRSVDKLTQALGANAMRTAKKKNLLAKKNPPVEDPPQRHRINTDEVCSYCGQRGLGKKATLAIRKTACPAYGTKCQKCNKSNHYK